jgi:hypothetical protein
MVCFLHHYCFSLSYFLLDYNLTNINGFMYNGTGINSIILFAEVRKWTVSVIVLVASVYLILNRGKLTWIDNFSLVIHEAGHFFFIMFGKFFYTFGGTLMQIILPYIVFLYFKRKGYRTGMQISLLWIGQNLINISVYAADARARTLPLAGGKNVYHDWDYMLSKIGLIQYDQETGYFFMGLAVLTFLISFLIPLIYRD